MSEHDHNPNTRPSNQGPTSRSDRPNRRGQSEVGRGGAANLDRREFVKTMGAAGVAGAVGSLGAGPLLGAQRRNPVSSLLAQDYDFPTPDGIRPGGQSDSRFPVSYHDPVQNALRLTMDYFTALNQRDIEGVAETLHFPFAINEDIEPIVFDSPGELISNPAPTLNFTSQGLSRVGEDSYDIFEGVDIHLFCPVGAVTSLNFQRFNRYGYKLGDYDVLLSVTNNDHVWAIQMVSSIFHELGYEGIRYPFIEEEDITESQGYLAAFGYGDEETLNNLSIGRGSYDNELPAGTRVASVSFGYGPRDRTRNAREGTPMAGWEVSGVESRLNVRETQPTPEGARTQTGLDEFADLAGQTVGEYSYTRVPPHRPVVIHATHDKAHLRGGYYRFTPEGELISETRSVGIRIYKGGVWAGAGGLGQVTHHDRSNSPAL